MASRRVVTVRLGPLWIVMSRHRSPFAWSRWEPSGFTYRSRAAAEEAIRQEPGCTCHEHIAVEYVPAPKRKRGKR